jgi:hypothetical protein
MPRAKKPAPASAAKEADSAKPRKRGRPAGQITDAPAPAASGKGAAGKGSKAKAPEKEAPKPEPKKMGRPSAFSEDLAAEICERIALGETLTSIVAEPHMPDPATVWRWQRADDEFRKRIAHAREEQTRVWADQIIDLSDDSTNDWTTRTRANGEPERVLDREHIERVKVRISSRQWLMARINRADYGDKSQIDVTHGLQTTDDAELAAKIRDLGEKLGVAVDPKTIGL